MAEPRIGKLILLDKVHLDRKNPRHDKLDSADEVISFLCKHELVYPLAADIAEFGINPLELFAVIPVKPKGNFIVAEGNRRLCALKLLNDPDLAPADLRKKFEKISEKWTPIKHVPVYEFKDREEAKLWLLRTHSGVSGGVGRKPWNSEQKTRFTGAQKNLLAHQLLNYAQDKGFISADQRKGKLTTVQRFVSNRTFKVMMGIDAEKKELHRKIPERDFDQLVNSFMGDLLEKDGANKKVTSRKNKVEIEDYGKDLLKKADLSGKNVDSEPVDSDSKSKDNKKPTKPKKPKVPKKLDYDDETHEALRQSYKLHSLYYSICEISIEFHTPMVAIGCWAFLESLTGAMGRSPKTSIDSYLTTEKMQGLGLPGKNKPVREALKRVCEYGNTTKHDAVAATFDKVQLHNDMAVLAKLILVCARDAFPES